VSFAGSGYLGSHQVGMILVTLLLLVGLYAFFRFTTLGLAMRAAAQNPASARLVGVRVDWMLALGWGLAAAVGAVAGAMVAPVVYLEPNMMASILLYGFASALVGGISSPGGAVAGGFIVGVLENLIAYFGNLLEKTSGLYLIGNGEKLTVALVLVIIVLTLKPQGLFGQITIKRV
jgi:branched-chain amino acid transport system permease protein